MTSDCENSFAKAKEHFLSGLSYLQRERWIEAESEFRASLSYVPDRISTLTNLSAALIKQRKYEDALTIVNRAQTIEPNSAELIFNSGVLRSENQRHEEALESFDRAIDLRPDYSEAWSRRGITLYFLRRFEEALFSFDRAIELNPDLVEAWRNRGNTLNELLRYEDAIVSYERAVALKSDTAYVLGDLVHVKMKICDWTSIERRCEILEKTVRLGGLTSSPLPVLGLFDSPQLHKMCAENYALATLHATRSLGPIGATRKGLKIRLGYFSMDFREHPVSQLLVEVIERHDRSRFEIYGFSFGKNTGDAMRKRLERAFDTFFDVKEFLDVDIARLARDYNIDVAIDLGGYTQGSRPAVFAHRAAPIQINYLGFPGTMGSEHMDYFIGDRVTVAPDELQHFSEKVIFLPNSFQPNPSERPLAANGASRADWGLPDAGFVFCCFNNIWKVTPDVFRSWVRILERVEDGVLWLQVGHEVARRNLLAEFDSAGIDPARIVFADRVPSLSDHLSRYRSADIFLDTFPYGAHTTASDALWMGLPVLTRSGKSFASRVAASLLQAVGLPELVTHSQEEYESLAIELAQQGQRVAELKWTLERKRRSCPLFNTELYVRHIESAFSAAFDRHIAGLDPDHLYIVPDR